jgi:hypothetical protein
MMEASTEEVVAATVGTEAEGRTSALLVRTARVPVSQAGLWWLAAVAEHSMLRLPRSMDRAVLEAVRSVKQEQRGTSERALAAAAVTKVQEGSLVTAWPMLVR